MTEALRTLHTRRRFHKGYFDCTLSCELPGEGELDVRPVTSVKSEIW